MRKRFAAVHTIINKVTGAMLFILPLTLTIVPGTVWRGKGNLYFPNQRRCKNIFGEYIDGKNGKRRIDSALSHTGWRQNSAVE